MGKVLTYAAYRDAKTVIWIAEQFSDEHRKTIDWLNERLSAELNLYAVEVELWRIDQSKPALRFNVLNPSKQPAPAPPEGAKKTQLDFWTAFRQELLAKKVVATAQAARPQYWFDIGLGRANIHLSDIANTQEGRIGVRVYVGNKVASMALPQLEAERVEIESEIGEKLQWNPNPDSIDKIIKLDRAADLSDRDMWPEYISWLSEKTAAFKKAFQPRVRKLDLREL